MPIFNEEIVQWHFSSFLSFLFAMHFHERKKFNVPKHNLMKIKQKCQTLIVITPERLKSQDSSHKTKQQELKEKLLLLKCFSCASNLARWQRSSDVFFFMINKSSIEREKKCFAQVKDETSWLLRRCQNFRCRKSLMYWRISGREKNGVGWWSYDFWSQNLIEKENFRVFRRSICASEKRRCEVQREWKKQWRLWCKL